MKTGKTVKILLLLGVMMLPGILFAEKSTNSFKRVKIRVDNSLRNPVSSTISSKISANRLKNSWLLIFVDYTPETAKVEWLENITMEVQVFVPVPLKKNRLMYVVFSGKTLFRLVSADGKQRTAVMAVPPHFLDRYLERELTPGTVTVKTTFRNEQKNLLGTGWQSPRSRKDIDNYFTKILKHSSTIPVENSVLPREKTPWRFMNFDQGDLVLEQ